MTNIHQKADFINYTLSNATNAQLKFLGLKPSERDGLMEKEIILGNHYDTPWAMTALDKKLSLEHKKTFIQHEPFYDASDADQNFLIAQEVYKAAKLWDKGALSNAGKVVESVSRFALLVLGGANAWKGDPISALQYTGVLAAGGVYSNYKSYQQEKAAMRFACLMEPDFYHHDMQKVPAVSFEENMNSILNGDPTEELSERHFRQAINECHKGNLLFPKGREDYDAAFEDYQKPRIIIKIGFY